MEFVVNELESCDDNQSYMNVLKQLTCIDPNLITYDMFINQFNLIKSNPFHKIFVARHNNIIIGSTTVLIEPKFIHNLSCVGHIEDVVVDSKYRSYGIGKMLINKAIDHCKTNKCYKIILDCSKNCVGFYSKMGFVEKETQMVLYMNN
ncbi:putative glucosamine 6-phosphate N-acetyltransferase [Cotonvirus japonicus]|uniref:Glucosamine 6-phosphate N-acetyltransferase n=1 Tax=Cotonvirus japonicus TaxID=2811091 RepID=A0ABM7NSX3_9VIRU|nr:putative glucosamine 6-phosphate N-acetyltransferase [Cotonvirus japonicus]BCS83270.1 putative glucosamine 6-phosphate N-acetyltransferase [Cotonvirus japonicus]